MRNEPVARKLPKLQRRLGTADLFGVAYGEIASSIYFALGIIAFHALGFVETGRTAHPGFDHPTSVTMRKRLA